MAGSPSIASLFAQKVVIGVGDMAVSNSTSTTLSTYALGSCVGVIAYDPGTHTGGILHLMLPESKLSPEKAQSQPAMFADTGLPALFKALVGLRVDLPRLRLFVAGGASVLNGTDPFKIGDRNLAAVKKFPQGYACTVCGYDVGGTVNRTVHLEVASGKVTLRLPDRTESHALGL